MGCVMVGFLLSYARSSCLLSYVANVQSQTTAPWPHDCFIMLPNSGLCDGSQFTPVLRQTGDDGFMVLEKLLNSNPAPFGVTDQFREFNST